MKDFISINFNYENWGVNFQVTLTLILRNCYCRMSLEFYERLSGGPLDEVLRFHTVQ